MYSLFRELSTQRIVLEQVPIFFISFFIANAFYKFGNFGLELIAFLATWFIADALFQVSRNFLLPRK